MTNIKTYEDITFEYFEEYLNNKNEMFFNVSKLQKMIFEDLHTREVWRKVKVYDDELKYEVSNKGNVRHSVTKKPIPKNYTLNEYCTVALYSEREKRKYLCGVHRLMAFAFLKIPKKYIKAGYDAKTLVVNHKDGFKHHNMLYNLEWCTVKENMTHAIDHNLVWYLGENCHLAKIDEKTAHKICKLICKSKNNKYISEKLGVSMKTIKHIRSRECWRHVSKNYVFPKLNDHTPNSTPEETIRKICELLELKKYSDTEIGKMCGKCREYVRDIRIHRILNKISKDYNF